MVAAVSLAIWVAETGGLQGQDQPGNLARRSQNKDWRCSSEVEETKQNNKMSKFWE